MPPVDEDGRGAEVSTNQPGHRTLTLHEWHRIGPDGLPVRHRTMQVIRSLRPGLQSYTYRFDRREAEVEVVNGAVAGEPYDDETPGLTAVDLVFPRPLDIGETTSIEYVTVFHWTSVPPPHFRRAARSPVDRVDVRLVFDSDRLPAEVRWGLWGGYSEGARLLASERVQLGTDHSVQRFVEQLQGHTVGFAWAWAPGQEPVAPDVG
jgi:hypothetical protein